VLSGTAGFAGGARGIRVRPPVASTATAQDPAGGPHRCVGSNLARMNLRVALAELVRRLTDIRLKPGADIGYHSTFNRAPLSVPITFTPGTPTPIPTPDPAPRSRSRRAPELPRAPDPPALLTRPRS